MGIIAVDRVLRGPIPSASDERASEWIASDSDRSFAFRSRWACRGDASAVYCGFRTKGGKWMANRRLDWLSSLKREM